MISIGVSNKFFYYTQSGEDLEWIFAFLIQILKYHQTIIL